MPQLGAFIASGGCETFGAIWPTGVRPLMVASGGPAPLPD